MIVRLAGNEDVPGFLDLAGQVEQWFGPMVGEPGFRTALAKHIRRGTALVAYHVRWLAVSGHTRGEGIGRALVADAIRRFVTGRGTVEVVTFGADHPGASASGARAFYERLGFSPSEPVAPGPEGGSRQVYRKFVTVSDRHIS